MNDGSQGTSRKVELGNVDIENNRLEGVELHSESPGYAVMNRGTFSPFRSIQALTNSAVAGR